MIERKLDAQFVNNVFRTSFADPTLDFTADIARPDVYALDHEFGVVLFFPGGTPGAYSCGWLAIKDTWSAQADIIALIDDTHEWMFLNTIAILIDGRIPSSKTGYLAAVKKTRGRKLVDQGETVFTVAPIGQWARNIGIQAAIDQLTANGWTEKAAKLKAAAGL